jgi:hypothetical protein
MDRDPIAAEIVRLYTKHRELLKRFYKYQSWHLTEHRIQAALKLQKENPDLDYQTAFRNAEQKRLAYEFDIFKKVL